MKAMILAAGTGARLRPLTDRLPKPMLLVAGRPLLEHSVSWLARNGVTDIVINLHHHADVVRSHFGDGTSWNVRIQYSFEPALLGTAGALVPWREFFDQPFFVLYGDNLITCRLNDFAAYHRSRRADATVALFWRDDAGQSGIAMLDANRRVLRFCEKPGADQVFSNWVNAGLLLLEPHLLETIPVGRPSDFGRELLPLWVEQGRHVSGYTFSDGEGLRWIDTPQDLERVFREVGSGGTSDPKPGGAW